MIVSDFAGAHKGVAESELPRQHSERSRTKSDKTILSGLGRVLVDSTNTGLVDRERTLLRIEVRNHESTLLGWTQSCEEPELVIVPLRFAPVPMDGGDERFGILNAEGIDDGSVSPSDSGFSGRLWGHVARGYLGVQT